MKLALFDLDNTLLAGDSDVLWGDFLSSRGLVDRDKHAAANQQFFADYEAGTLDMQAFLRFQLRFLAETEPRSLMTLRDEYFETCVEPCVLPKARELIEGHRRRGHTLVIITATNRFLTEPVADALAVDALIATEVEHDGHRYTGNSFGVPSFGPGKVTRIEQWLASQGDAVCESWSYSDSHNDIPLLEWSDHPHAVDPDSRLREAASQSGWPILSLR